jgi:biopolymer transport protein ExbD
MVEDLDPAVSGTAAALARPLAPLKPRRQVASAEIDITPMIDMTFLLLIFFLVTSKLERASQVELPPARYGVPVATQSAVVLTIDQPRDGGPAVVYKGDGIEPGRRIDTADLQALEQEIESYVRDTMLEQSSKTHVLIKAARGVRHREVARVAQVAGRVAEVQQLHVAVLEER